MSIEILSGAVYRDTTKAVVQKQRVDNSSQEQNVANMNITELPSSSIKTSGNSQTDKEQNDKKNSDSQEQHIKNAISRANSKMKSHRTGLEFSYHEDTGRVSIKVYDKNTDEIIREIPPEETLDMLKKMWELEGLLVDEKR